MSHRIEYFHLAVRYPEEALQAALPEELFFGDYYLCLALGGDNNMTTRHPTTGREVCSRRWDVVAAGGAAECIKHIARHSGECEVGHMRLTGERHTKPEAYIRSWRSAIEHAVPFDRLLSDAGVSAQATLLVSRERGEERADAVKRLSAHMLPVAGAEDSLVWNLNLLNARDAAIYFQYDWIVPGMMWEKTKADGPRFAEGFRRVMRARSLLEAA